MMVAGYEISLAYVLIAGGLILLGSAFKVYKLPVSKSGAFVLGILLIGGGAWQAGWFDTSTGGTGTGTAVTEDQYTTGLTMIVYLKDIETRGAIASKTLYLFPYGTTIQDIQSSKVTPLASCSAVTDSAGKTTFTGLEVGKYAVSFWNDEAAFDGTDYTAAVMDVELKAIDKDLKTKETYAEPSDSLYVKKIGDVFYTITATSGSNSSSGGVNAAATITEDGTGGTTVHVTISSNTNQAWLTDPIYYNRVYLSSTFTDNGDANTAITLADCKMNSSTGQNLTKDSSGSYYVDVNSSVMKNTTKNQNETFTFTLWVSDLGDIGTTADTLAITFKYTLVRKDATNVNVLQDTGLAITITQATG